MAGFPQSASRVFSFIKMAVIFHFGHMGVQQMIHHRVSLYECKAELRHKCCPPLWIVRLKLSPVTNRWELWKSHISVRWERAAEVRLGSCWGRESKFHLKSDLNGNMKCMLALADTVPFCSIVYQCMLNSYLIMSQPYLSLNKLSWNALFYSDCCQAQTSGQLLTDHS